jgi:class 3 adenylate cyclase
MTATRRLAAILAADVAGYSRLIGADEGGTLQALKAIRAELNDPTIAAHNGRLVKTTGDGLLVELSSVKPKEGREASGAGDHRSASRWCWGSSRWSC